MGSVADRIKARYRDSTLSCEVPEWGEEGEPLVVYWQPYTLADERRLRPYVEGDNPEGWAAIVIAKALDESGDPIFTKADKPTLMHNAEAHVLKRVAMAIYASQSVEGHAGN